jgi:pilus assembly protein CpaE
MIAPETSSMSNGDDSQDRVIAPVPRVTIQAFCETADLAQTIEEAADDRRMQKAHVKVQMGGAAAAVEAYRHAATPNVIVIESHGDRSGVLAHLERLSEVCDAGTKVIVVGHLNDVMLYRDLTRRGVSEYLMAPVNILDFVRAISELFTSADAEPVGRTIAIVGTKGGVGASTIAHNLAWAVAGNLMASTVIVDLDVAFGTAALDFNQDPPQSIAEAIFAPDRIDANLVDRLLSKCSEHLSLLAAPAMLDRTIDLAETSIDALIDVLRASVPTIVLDIPHTWTAWARRTLVASDEVVIVAAPELASLRNAKNLFDTLRQSRPNDHAPKVVLNLTGMPKRPEIGASEFAKALGIELSAVLPFDAQLFGAAANNGQMIAEVQPSGKVAQAFTELACAITGRAEPKRRGKLLEPILATFARLKAS